SKAKRLHMEENIDLIIVDYMGLMLQRGDNNVQEMSEITRSLKLLARDLNVPLLAISQLSRAPELRPNHRPLLSDLRESGSIEQDADVVMFIYRDDVYYTEDEWAKLHPDVMYPKGIVDIIVGKHRHGPTGTIQLKFVDKLAKFEQLPIGVA
ncbi:MAG: DnaB-like helicase C-terminal domain-containing protein, partial [Chloroflexi bacterium]|nr:DnaB-like helicase C-terminal domain-containing protein [Chloroflexota bacterium]